MIRTAYLKKVEEKLQALVVEIEKLKAKAVREEAPEIREAYRKQIEALNAGLERVGENFRTVRESLEGEWGRSKAGVEKSLQELRKAVEAAIEKFRKSA